MASIKVFNGEKFDRNSRRYIIFSTVFIGIILLSILSGNFVGAVIIFFLLGGYLYYTLNVNQVLEIKIKNGSLFVGEKNVPWSNYTGFVMEIEIKSDSIKNIVLVSGKSHNIFTINDEVDSVLAFLEELVKYMPRLDSYEQSVFEKLSRKFQL